MSDCGFDFHAFPPLETWSDVISKRKTIRTLPLSPARPDGGCFRDFMSSGRKTGLRLGLASTTPAQESHPSNQDIQVFRTRKSGRFQSEVRVFPDWIN
jgi:hypothetical protein